MWRSCSRIRKISPRGCCAGKFNDAAGNALRAEDFDVVLVDPPRAGLDDDTLELGEASSSTSCTSRADRIIC